MTLAGREWRQDQEWELIHHRGANEHTERFRINGGWLYRTQVRVGMDELFAMTFVPEQESG